MIEYYDGDYFKLCINNERGVLRIQTKDGDVKECFGFKGYITILGHALAIFCERTKNEQTKRISDHD